MGPESYEQIRSALDDAELKLTRYDGGGSYGAFVSPVVEETDKAVPFLTVSLADTENQSVAGIFNALLDYVVFDPDTVPTVGNKPLLFPLHISSRTVLFHDLNHNPKGKV